MARPKTLSAAEKKTVRVSLMMTPALYADISTLAQIKRTTINDLVCSLATQVVKKNRQTIDDASSAMKNYAAQIELTLDFGDEE